MFICHVCLEANEINSGYHFRSFGPCEVCGNKGECLDIPTWQLPDRPLISHEVSFMREEDHGSKADA